MRRKKEGEHDNLERWLLTYSDLITLLLGLFVILYASSQVDMNKFRQMVSAFENVFGGGASGAMPGSTGMMSAPAPSNAANTAAQQMERKVESTIGTSLKKSGAIITYSERGVTIHFLEKFMFDVGKADIKPGALPVLDTLGSFLEEIPNEIRIEGHTDNTPIRTVQFQSNWHLSVARALNVGYYLLQHYKIRPEKVSIIGYGEYHPIVPNDTPQHKAENRRVDIVILNNYAKK